MEKYFLLHNNSPPLIKLITAVPWIKYFVEKHYGQLKNASVTNNAKNRMTIPIEILRIKTLTLTSL